MVTWVGSTTEHIGLVLVLQVVLYVTHLMVNRDQVCHGHISTLLDPEDKLKKGDTINPSSLISLYHWLPYTSDAGVLLMVSECRGTVLS